VSVHRLRRVILKPEVKKVKVNKGDSHLCLPPLLAWVAQNMVLTAFFCLVEV
jgi:hypothetical protein